MTKDEMKVNILASLAGTIDLASVAGFEPDERAELIGRILAAEIESSIVSEHWIEALDIFHANVRQLLLHRLEQKNAIQ